MQFIHLEKTHFIDYMNITYALIRKHLTHYCWIFHDS